MGCGRYHRRHEPCGDESDKVLIKGRVSPRDVVAEERCPSLHS